MAGGNRERHGWTAIDDGQLVGCDKQRAGTPNHRSGVPALPLVTPYKFTNWRAVKRTRRKLTPAWEDTKVFQREFPRLPSRTKQRALAIILCAVMSETIGERHASACRYKNEVPEGSRRSARRIHFRPRGVCIITRKTHLSDPDVLIVGQGIAGSCMAWALHWAGRRVMIVDRGEPITASRIAAGLITPVTGRRMVPMHGYKESFRYAAAFFRRIERELNCLFLDEKPAIRQFVNHDEQCAFEKKLCGSDVRFATLKDDVGRVTGIEMLGAARLNVPRFLEQTRQYFASLGRYQQAELNPDTDIVINQSGVLVAGLDIRSACVVFCQGYQPIRNCWFPTIPDGPAKGEILRVRLADRSENKVIHKGVWLVPDGSEADEASFLLGATYDRVHLNDEPTTAGREELLSGLKHITAETPVVIDHVAAIRAGMKRRKPIIGPHPDSDRVFVLNGLGSRGALLAPVAAQALTDLICGNAICVDQHDVFDVLPGKSATEPAATNSSRPKSLTQLAHNVIRRIVQPGDTVIDATAGNGNDTQMLATLVEAIGRTIAIDIQQSAIDSTSNRLAKAGLTADLRLGDHASELRKLQSSGLCVKAVMFNLGYLPGSDQQTTTLPTSTRAAIQSASEMLLPQGAVTIIAYRGHAGGLEEAAIVEQWIAELPADCFETFRMEGDPTQATSPVLFVVRTVNRGVASLSTQSNDFQPKCSS